METIIVVIVVIFFAIIFSIGMLKDVKEKSKPNKFLEDELLYDFMTGKEYTLEEVEGGVIFSNGEENRILTENEIEKYYRDDRKQLAYIRNHITKNELFLVERQEYKILVKMVSNLGYYRKYENFFIDYFVKIGNSGFIGLCELSYTLLEGKFYKKHIDKQLVGIINARKDLGNAYIIPFTISSLIINRFFRGQKDIIKSHNVKSNSSINKGSSEKCVLIR